MGTERTLCWSTMPWAAEPGTATLHISRANPTVTTLSQRWIDQVQTHGRLRQSGLG